MHKSIVLNRVHWYWLPLFMVLGYALYSLGTLSYAQSAQDDAVSDNVTANVPETDTPQLIEHIQPDQKKIETQVDPVLQDPTPSLQTPLDQSPQPANMSVEPELPDPNLSVPPLQNPSDELSQPTDMQVKPELPDSNLSLPSLPLPIDQSPQPEKTQAAPQTTPSDQLDQQLSVPPDLPVNTQSPKKELDTLMQKEIIKTGEQLQQNGNVKEVIKQESKALTQQHIVESAKNKMANFLGQYGKVDMEININDQWKLGHYNFEYLYPFHDQFNKQLLMQMGAIEFQNRHILHIGAGFRVLDYGIIMGANGFIDGDLTTQHLRYSLGLEYGSDIFLLRSNIYLPISDEKNNAHLSGTPYDRIQPVYGVDLNATTVLWPKYSLLGELNYNQWFGKNIHLSSSPYHSVASEDLYDDMYSWDAKINWQPFSLLSSSLGLVMMKNQKKPILNTSFTLTWQFDRTLDEQLKLNNVSRSMKDNLLRYFFKREHRVFLSYLEKHNKPKKIDSVLLPDKKAAFEAEDVMIQPIITMQHPVVSHKWSGSGEPYLKPIVAGSFDAIFSKDNMIQNTEQYELQLQLTDQNNKAVTSNKMMIYLFQNARLELYKDSAKINVVTNYKVAHNTAQSINVYWKLYDPNGVATNDLFVRWEDPDSIFTDPTQKQPTIDSTQSIKSYKPQLVVLPAAGKEVRYDVSVEIIQENARLKLYKDRAKSQDVDYYEVRQNTSQAVDVYWELYDKNGVATNDSFVRWQDPENIFTDPRQPNPTIDSTKPIKSYKPKLVVLPATGYEVSYNVSVDIIQELATLKLYKDSAKKHDMRDYTLDQNTNYDVNVYWELYDKNGIVANYSFVRWQDPDSIFIDPSKKYPTIDSKKPPKLYNPQLIISPVSGDEVRYDVSVNIVQVGVKTIFVVDKVQFINTNVTVRVEISSVDPDNAVVTVKDTANTIVSDAKFAHKGSGIYEGKIKSVPWGKFSIFSVVYGIEHKKITANIDTHKLYVIENPYLSIDTATSLTLFSYDENAVVDPTYFSKLLKDPTVFYEISDTGSNLQDAGPVLKGMGNILIGTPRNRDLALTMGISSTISARSLTVSSIVDILNKKPFIKCSVKNDFTVDKGGVGLFIKHFTNRQNWLNECRFKDVDSFRFDLKYFCYDNFDMDLSFELGNQESARVEHRILKTGAKNKFILHAFKLGLKCYKP